MADTIRIGGTGAALGTMRLLGEAYTQSNPGHTIKIIPSLGSGGGIKALQAGALDIAVIGRDLRAKEAQPGQVVIEYGKTPFLFATHSKVPISNVSLEQVAEIYGGNQTAWPDGALIRVILRPASESDIELLSSISPAIKQAVKFGLKREGMVMAATDIDSADAIEHLPNSFGTSTLALVLSEKRALNILSLEGVTPSVETLANGTYRYTKNLSMLLTQQSSKTAREFVKFVQSLNGRKILEQTGHYVSRK
ncbi:MAG: substrate-binding domain-containing protein [Gammaproteobacteria bacterium]